MTQKEIQNKFEVFEPNVENDSESMPFDVVIVGGGPSGLTTAIKLAQNAKVANKNLDICVLEKGSCIGAHILSGATFEPQVLNELIPNWQELNHPIKTKAKSDELLFLSKKFSIKLPTPPGMHNEGNYIVSLGKLCSFLAEYAENLGVQIFPGFAASKPLFNKNGEVIGVKTANLGIDKEGNKKSTYQPGINLLAKQTILAEGCRGSISEEIIKQFNLNKDSDPQTYGLGIKELWEIPEELYRDGHITHTLGWPLNMKTYGGSFLYHYDKNKLAVGLVIGLDYENPYLNPFEEFQRLKHHPKLKKYFEHPKSKRISYGARTLNEGGLQSIPKLCFPGGLLVGCSAGFVNTSKGKGIHTAMKSGIIAADSVFAAIIKKGQKDKSKNNNKNENEINLDQANSNKITLNQINSYQENINNSDIYKELYLARNLRPAFKFGLPFGMFYAGMDTYLFRGRAPWTLHHKPDHLHLKPASKFKPIKYPKPDNKISFDILTSVSLTGTNHEENQPKHIKFKNHAALIDINFKVYNSPEQRYCPAKVYELINKGNKNQNEGSKKLEVNFTNCLHCKACDIKDPNQNIKWTPPEGSGPKYSEM